MTQYEAEDLRQDILQSDYDYKAIDDFIKNNPEVVEAVKYLHTKCVQHNRSIHDYLNQIIFNKEIQ